MFIQYLYITWAARRLKSAVTHRPCVQQLVQGWTRNKNFKTSHCWLFVRVIHQGTRISLKKGAFYAETLLTHDVIMGYPQRVMNSIKHGLRTPNLSCYALLYDQWGLPTSWPKYFPKLETAPALLETGTKQSPLGKRFFEVYFLVNKTNWLNSNLVTQSYRVLYLNLYTATKSIQERR